MSTSSISTRNRYISLLVSITFGLTTMSDSNMDAILAAYASASSSSAGASGSESDASSTASPPPPPAGAIGAKRKRQGETPARPQWKRAFPHVAGQWPSHVRVCLALDSHLQARVEAVIASAQEILGDTVTLIPLVEGGEGREGGEDGENPATELHLSLSRPFTLTFDQIDAFVEALRTALKWRKRFQVSLGDALVLVNDDKTRSFLALRVDHGTSAFLQTLKCVDRCLALFQKPPYYEPSVDPEVLADDGHDERFAQDPIPHVSIASAAGEALALQLSPDRLDRLNCKDTQPSRGMAVTKVHAAIGNKHFEIPLA